MGERLDHIITRLEEKGEDTVVFFRRLSPEDYAQEVYTEGSRWDVRQVLCHFVSAERGYMRIFENVLQNGEDPPDDFDIDHFNESEVAKMADLSPDALIDQFVETRAATVAFVQALEEDDLDREGWHPFFGQDRLEKFLKLIYRHNMIHQRDVERALGERGA